MALRKDGSSRSPASFKPYDPSNSFVRKMTNTVTGLFGWRSNLQSDSQNFEDVLQSNSDIDRVSPAAKRMRVQCDDDRTLSKLIPSTSRVLADSCSPIKPVNDMQAAGPSNVNKCILSSTPANSFYRSPVFSTTSEQFTSKRVTQNADDSEATDISTTLPQFNVHQRHNITVPSLPKDVPSMMSNVDANKSLTGSFSSTNSRRPSFNVDVFSSSSRRLSLSVCEGRNRNCLSPFYSARTMYGGASALLPYGSPNASRMRSASTSKLDIFSPRSQITVQPVPSPNKLNDQEILSASARRILDSLEKFCSPVADAKRIPVNESTKKSHENTPQPSHRGIKRKLPALNQMLPSTSELLRIKRNEKIQDSISSAKQTISTVAESSIAADDSDSSSDSAELDYSVLSQEARENSSQYVRKLTRKNETKFDDRPAPVNLPNAVLKISNLPTFDVTDEFVFSKPLLLENLDQNKDESTIDGASKNESSTGSFAITSPVTTTSIAKTVPNDTKTTVSSIFSSSFKDVSPTVKMSLSPKVTSNVSLSTSKSFVSSSVSSTKSNSPKTINWTCMNCLAVNTADECSKCSQARPQKGELVEFPKPSCEPSKKDDPILKVSTTSNWGDKFKPPSDTWECSECLVRNKNASSECVACGKAKNNVPKAATTASTTAIGSSGFDWKNFKKPDGWSCSNCYVQNKESDMKCVACEEARESTKVDVTASSNTTKGSFSFGIDKNKATSTFGSANSIKFGSEDTPISSASFGATGAINTATFSFGFNQNSSISMTNTSNATVTALCSENVSKTMPESTFTFGVPKLVEPTVSNATSAFKNPLLSNTSVFGQTNTGDKITAEKIESAVFNDVSSGANKNPLLANESIFKTSKFGVPKVVTQENGDEKSNANPFKDGSSPSEAPKKKMSITFSATVHNSEPTNGLTAGKTDVGLANGGFGVANSSSCGSNTFVSSMSTSAFGPAPSKLTNDTHSSFASAAAAATKSDATFGDKSSSKLFASNSFGASLAPVTNSLFGNLTANTSIGAGVGSKSEATINTGSSGNASTFPAVASPFSFGLNAVSSPSTLKSESSSTNAAATVNVAVPATSSFTSATPAFNFGANVASTATPAATQPPSAGFIFNGPPKVEESVPKFGFGSSSTNATPFGGGGTSAIGGGSGGAIGGSQFGFGAALNSSAPTVEQPVTNSLFGPPNKVPAIETPSLNTTQITAFGNSVLPSVTPSQSAANPLKKSGGFNFNPSPFNSAPTVNNFSSFSNAAANQEPNRLNNSVAPVPGTFVFGSTNQTPQAHNFNPSLPAAFNFTGGNNNQMMPFTAQPTSTNVATNACGPTRKIKKAVRRTTQK